MLMQKTAHDNRPIHSDITNPPHACLPSRQPLRQDLVHLDTRSQWKNWKSTQVVNFSLVDGPQFGNQVSILHDNNGLCLTVFGLHRVTVAPVRKNGIKQTLICPCDEKQVMTQIVDSCPLTKWNGGLSQLHSADDETVAWLISYGS